MEDARDPRFVQWCELLKRTKFGPRLIERLKKNDVFDVLTIEMIDDEFLRANELRHVEIETCILWKNEILHVSEQPISKWIELLKTASFGKRIVRQMEKQEVLEFLQLDDVNADFLMAFNLQQWQIDCVMEWRNQCLAECEPEHYPWEHEIEDDNESVISSVITSMHSDISGVTSNYDGDLNDKLHAAEQELMVKNKKIEKLLRKVDKKRDKLRSAREEIQTTQSMLLSRDANLKQTKHQLHIVIADRVRCRHTLTLANRKMGTNISNLQALLEGQIMSCEGKIEEISRKHARIVRFLARRGGRFTGDSKAQSATVHALQVELEMLQDTRRNESSEHDRQKRDMQRQIDILSGVNGGSMEQELSMMLRRKEKKLAEALAHVRASTERNQTYQRDIKAIQASFQESITELERVKALAQSREEARVVLQDRVEVLMGQLAGSGVSVDSEMQSDVFNLRQKQHQEQIAELEHQVRTSMQSSSQEILRLREQVKQLQEQKHIGIKKYKELANENTRLKSGKEGDLMRQLEDIRATNEELEKKVSDRGRTIKQLENKLRSSNSSGKGDKSSGDSDAKQLRATLANREGKIKALEDAQKSLARGNSILEEKIVDLKAQLMDAETARARLSHNLQRRDSMSSPRAKEDLKKLKEKLNTTSEELKQKTNENKTLESRVMDLQTHFEQLQGKMEIFQRQHQETIQEKKLQIADMQNLNMQQKDIVMSLQNEVETLQEANAALANQSGSHQKEHKQKLTMLKDEIDSMTQQYEEAKIEINRLETQLSKTTAELESEQAKLAEASKEASSQADNKYNEMQEKLNLEKQQLKRELENQGRQIATMEKNELKLNKKVDILVKGKSSAEEALNSTREELTKLKTETSGANAKMEKMKQDVNALKNQLQYKTKHAATLQKDIDNLKETHESEKEKLKADYDKQKDSLRNIFIKEKASLEQSVRFLSSKTQNMEEQIRKEYDMCQDLKAVLFNIKEEQVTMKEVVATQMLECKRSVVDAFKDSKARYEKINATAKREMGLRKKYWNIVQDLRGNVRVFCRVRPLLGFELRKGYASCLDFPEKDQLNVALFDKKSNQTYSHFFEFDKVYPPDSAQEQVCADTSEYIQSVMDGYHVSVFAYGQTGSGKTYTMMGPEDNPGVNRRALAELFAIQERRKQFFEYEVRLAIFEIYNDKPRDLLASKPKAKYEVRDDKWGNPHIPGLKDVPVSNIEEVLDQIAIAETNRHVANTEMNSDSSRSHMLMEISVKGLDKAKDKKIRGRLYLVDLAGSERVGKSGVTGKALTEAKHINKSLSSLGDVMAALQKKEKFIPYRNSTLTKIMQNALSPNGKTVMFVNICPTNEHVGETLSSLKFAKRVGKVELGSAQANVKKAGKSRKGTIDKTERRKGRTNKLDSLASDLIGSTPSRSVGRSTGRSNTPSRSSARSSSARSRRRPGTQV